MKIEKLNENQVKFILNNEDLQEWNIKLTELTQGSERTQELFHDMMEQASNECDFHVDNTPLLIEAIPQAVDCVVIIVTKVTSPGEIEEKFNYPPLSKLVERFRQKGTIEQKATDEEKEPLSVFSFNSLDDVTDVAVRLKEVYWGANSLFKHEGRYFLLLHHDEHSGKLQADDMDAVLAEYGLKHASTGYSQYYLKEHGEVIIEHSAINILSRI